MLHFPGHAFLLDHTIHFHPDIQSATVRPEGDTLEICDCRWEDLEEVISPRSTLLQITLRGGTRIGLYSHRAGQIARMIQDFSDEADRVSEIHLCVCIYP